MKKEGSLLGRLVSATAALRPSPTTPNAPQKSPPAPSTPNPSLQVEEEEEEEEGVRLEEKVEGWMTALKAGLEQDKSHNHQEALLAYNRLNRQLTRDSILEYEQLTQDQKKLLTHVLTCLDHRTQHLRALIRSGNNTGTQTGGQEGTEVAEGLAEVEACVDVLETIRRMRGKGRVHVVLVYRERKHRTRHRHQDKGQSNKVVFAKEKRDFLSLLGLPGSMISERGLDFTVRPNTASNERRVQESVSRNKKRDNGELEPDEKNGGGAVAKEGSTSGGSVDECEGGGGSPRRARQILNQVLPFMKRGSVSPQRQQQTPSTSSNHSTSLIEQDNTSNVYDARSTLSCDSCSSDESSETEEEADIVTDTAVPGTYIHRENLKPASLARDGLHVTLHFDKLGLRSTTRLVAPFLRVSVRDSSGCLAWGSSVQETAQWEVVNRHYLTTNTRVYIQPALDDLPHDMAIFLEMRSHRPDRGVLSTLCYTFLERQDLSSGEFICELYSPPVDYTRKVLTTYTEKAFFLHLHVSLHRGGSEREGGAEGGAEGGGSIGGGSVGGGEVRSQRSQRSVTPS